jgi:membrane protein YdbS with pleckstrin-like domain
MVIVVLVGISRIVVLVVHWLVLLTSLIIVVLINVIGLEIVWCVRHRRWRWSWTMDWQVVKQTFL